MKEHKGLTAFFSGDQAVAQGAYEDGLGFAASYPGTPASEILEYLAGFPDMDCQWSVNEKVAYEVALSASISGVRSLFSCKHVGLNVAMDALMTSAYTGVGAGFLIVNCDDPGIHSSQNEQDNRLAAAFAKIPLLEPSSPSEAREFAKLGFSISEEFDTPVMIRMTTRIAHTKENMSAGPRQTRQPLEFKIDTAKYVMVPKNAYKRHIILEKRLRELQKYSERAAINKIELKDSETGFITAGVSYLYIKEMYPQASVLKLGMPFPFPAELAREFAGKVKNLYVIEELEPFLEDQLRALGIKAVAKDRSFRVGELRPEYLPLILEQKEKSEEEAKTRKPVMCPGCPHRQVFWVLKKVKAVVAGDIGCYTLGALPPISSLHTCLCMGSGITFSEGLRKGAGANVVGVIGDSTFIHSGITGLINLAYNRSKGLVMILDNSTTAMTGNQPHPGVGLTIKCEPTKKLSIEDICRASGADNVDVVNPYDVQALEALVRKRIAEDKLSVIISRFPCRLISKARASSPEYLKETCKKCAVCLSIDCPSLNKDEEGFITINKETCSGCGLCASVCGFKALKKNEN